jgi:hypothetical protein
MDDSIHCARWSADGERIVFTTGPWHTVESRNRAGDLLWMHDFRCGDESPLLVALDPSGTWACTWRFHTYFGRVFDSRTGACALELTQISPYCDQVTWTGDGTCLVALGEDGVDIVPLPFLSGATRPPDSVLRLRMTTSGVAASRSSL